MSRRDLRYGRAVATVAWRAGAQDTLKSARIGFIVAGMIDALPVHALTRAIPIVVIEKLDLVEAGLANSLGPPGGNVTGIVVRGLLGGELDGKTLELLRELVPAIMRISVLDYAGSPRGIPRIAAIEALAPQLGLHAAPRLVSKPNELNDAFAASAASQLTDENRLRIVPSGTALPAIDERRESVEEGGLFSYG
jgi:putative ABC transport system substrate-binding protein